MAALLVLERSLAHFYEPTHCAEGEARNLQACKPMLTYSSGS